MRDEVNDREPLLTPAEAREMLGVNSTHAVIALAEAGAFRRIRTLGGQSRYFQREIESYRQSKEEKEGTDIAKRQ